MATDRGDRFRARFVVTATGPLHRPKLPGVDGIDEFARPLFHTSRWDYAYTGGGPGAASTGWPTGGWRSSAPGRRRSRSSPTSAGAAAPCIVFQRTPSPIDVRGNRPTDPAWAACLRPGWQEERVRNFNALMSGCPRTSTWWTTDGPAWSAG